MKYSNEAYFNKILDSLVCYDGNFPIKDPDRLLSLLRDLLKIRAVELHLAQQRKNGLIGGPVHLGVGQEAIAVGISTQLSKSDRVFGAHRSHSHILALGSSIEKLFAEVLGRDSGLSRGMGGSMHLWDQPNGFYGSVPIVAGTVPLAVGAGLAAKLQKSDDIAVAYLGDGAVEEGVVHESFNLAKITNSPVLFVIENNFFASHMDISLRQPSTFTSRFAIANEIPFEVVDGNNLGSVIRSAKTIVESIRASKGPGIIEAITYRWLGHVDWRDDIDVGVNRSPSDIAYWKARDPIELFMKHLNMNSILAESKLKFIKLNIEDEINLAWNAALTAPFPANSALLDRVYAE